MEKKSNSKGMKKIVVIGPESTGKSTLCEMLAAHFGSDWCPEYARQYLLEHGRHYGYEDLAVIARGQLALEEGCLEQAGEGPLFIDTDLYVIKVWSEFVFGKCEEWILDEIAGRKYDLYLLCNTDLPWVKDELREYPDPETRLRLFHIYRDLLTNQATPWVEISGESGERFRQAVDATNALLNQP
jgi:NadR type nicotinamide-nucleotide adenylyltransferase